MLIAGFRKTSFIDYPGQPCAVVFTPYCNMNCSYCHNEQILRGDVPLISEDEVMDYLEKRAGLLKAVTVSGGEPTLQQNLIPFIETVKTLGYAVKLDTNGSKPDVLRELLQKKLLDYVAMDIKASPERYDEVTRVKNDLDAIRRSITLLRNSSVEHEFRTTFAPELTTEDVVKAAELVKGTERFYLQQYRPRHEGDPDAHVPSYVRETAAAVETAIGVCTVRGL